jgi:hypothetical protein
MRIRFYALFLFFAMISAGLVLGEAPAQVALWPTTGTPVLRLTLGKLKQIGAVGNQRTFVTETTVENLSEKRIASQRFLVYVFDKKQIRVGDAWILVSDLGAGQTTKFQTTFTSAGIPLTLTIEPDKLDFGIKNEPKKVTLTVNSIPQGAILKVDGLESGVTPKQITVGIGKHLLLFNMEGYNPGKFPLEVGPDDVSGGNVSYELGMSQFDTIELRDGSVLSGDVDSIQGMDIALRIGGQIQHFDRNRIKRILLVQRDPLPTDLPPAQPADRK